MTSTKEEDDSGQEDFPETVESCDCTLMNLIGREYLEDDFLKDECHVCLKCNTYGWTHDGRPCHEKYCQHDGVEFRTMWRDALHAEGPENYIRDSYKHFTEENGRATII